jgi:nitrate/nitrite transporter NarK
VAVPTHRLGTANGVIAFAYQAGPAFGTTLGGLLMNSVGWRPVFIIFGALSLLWLWPWSRVRVAEPLPRAAVGEAAAADDGPTFQEILRQRGLWGASLGHFAANYNFYFCLSWLPYYLVKSRDFSMSSMAGLLGSAYLINALAGLAGGWFCDVWIRGGRSANVIYKGTMALNHIVSIAAMIGMALLPLQGSIACLFAYEVVLGLSSPGIYAIPQIMAGPAATGRWVGVQNACGNLAGIFAPMLTGILRDVTGSFTSAFVLAALINILGVVGWIWILPRVAPLRWKSAGSAVAAA